MVVPRDPLERRELDVLEPLPRPAPTDYLSIRYTERLAEAGIERSVGRVGIRTITPWPRR